VVTFLTLPLVIFTLALLSQELGWMPGFHEHIRDYKFLSAFYQSVTALVFGLAGLQSIDRYAEAKHNGVPKHE